jgi:hypothetical protein
MSLVGFVGFAEAVTNPAFCVAIGPGRHAASFWYRTPDQPGSDEDVAFVAFSANFWTGPNCTGSGTTSELSADPAVLDDAWHQVAGGRGRAGGHGVGQLQTHDLGGLQPLLHRLRQLRRPVRPG